VARYTFGDSDLAAQRLQRVAATFELTTRALLERVRAHITRCTLVADLGPGPGYSTALLCELFSDAAIVGIEASAEFAARARAHAPRATIVIGDALALGTGTQYDVIYARYLLSHVTDVQAAIDTWCGALAPGGVLVLEEPEHIRSTDADFARYEQISSALVQASGGVFYAGPLIAAVTLPTGVRRIVDDAIAIDVTAAQAAAMFWRNAAVWGADAVAAGLTSGDEIDELVERLRQREREGDPTRGLFDWRQRQTALIRTG